MERIWPIVWRAAVTIWLTVAFAYNLYSEGIKFPFSVVFFAFVYVVLVAIWLKQLKVKLSARSLTLFGLSFLIAIFGSGTAIVFSETYPRDCGKSFGKAHAACALENLAYGIGGHLAALAIYAVPMTICICLFFVVLIKRPLKP